MGKIRVSVWLKTYKWIYGISFPTTEKIENTTMMSDILERVHDVAVDDAIKNKWTLPEVESIVRRKKDIKSETTEWLVDVVRKTYSQSYHERRQRP